MTDHDHLWRICRKLPSDFEPYGKRSRKDGADCSCGCRWFFVLEDRPEGHISFDWGICANLRSPRVGLLTFEHQGCKFFVKESANADTETE